VYGQFIAAYTQEYYMDEAAKRVLSSLDPQSILPKPYQLVHNDVHEALYLIQVLFLWAGHYTREYQVAKSIGKVMPKICTVKGHGS
jgi:hypothetical protein